MDEFLKELDTKVKEEIDNIKETEIILIKDMAAYVYYIKFKNNVGYSRIFSIFEHQEFKVDKDFLIDCIITDIKAHVFKFN